MNECATLRRKFAIEKRPALCYNGIAASGALWAQAARGEFDGRSAVAASTREIKETEI